VAIQQALLVAIKDAAPAAIEKRGERGGACLVFGLAEIEFFPIREVPLDPWEWTPPAFDVVASTGVIVRIPMKNGFKGRSHSLWFCDAEQVGRFQWYEVAFMSSPLLGGSSNVRPFMLDPGPEAAKALSNGLAELQLAWPLTPLDVGQLDEFIDRWTSWFAAAALGRLEPTIVDAGKAYAQELAARLIVQFRQQLFQHQPADADSGLASLRHDGLMGCVATFIWGEVQSYGVRNNKRRNQTPPHRHP
jgi:hypothetical protein